MVAVDSYDDLLNACQEALEDESTEFLEFLPIAVRNAELRLVKEVETQGKIFYDTISAVPGNPFVNKPSGYRVGRKVLFKNGTTNRKKVLRKKTNDFIDTYWPNETSTGQPKYYADYDGDFFIVAPAPASANDEFIVESEKSPTFLSSSNQTNHWTDNCPDALFYATMMECTGTYARNAELFQRYSELYIAARESLNNEGRRERTDDGQMPLNPEIGQNTLLGTR